MIVALKPRVLLLTLLLGALVVGLALGTDTSTAEAAEPDELIFPLIGPNNYSDTFGACRSGCSRRHQGVDMMSPKMTPIVAVDDGVVLYVNWSWDPDNVDRSRCCTMAIVHTDGYQSWYIHMNNDTPGTDDGLGWGIAEGIVPGATVYAGQLIGWVGDSGNAESVGSHLHFEYHAPDGTVLNPTPYVDGALVIAAPIVAIPYEVDFASFMHIVPSTAGEVSITGDSQAPWSVAVQGGQSVVFTEDGSGPATVSWDVTDIEMGPYVATVSFGVGSYLSQLIQVGDYEWPFIDDEGSYAAAQIAEMYDRGITTGCTWNRYCPSAPLVRAQLMTMIARSMAGGENWGMYKDYFVDVPEGEYYTGPIEYLVDNGILSYGGSIGVTKPATRALAVDLLMSAVGDTTYPEYQGYFSDVAENDSFRPKIERAFELGLALGYPDGTFGPYDTLTREEAAAFLMRGL